jgi:hypothetical protein
MIQRYAKINYHLASYGMPIAFYCKLSWLLVILAKLTEPPQQLDR